MDCSEAILNGGPAAGPGTAQRGEQVEELLTHGRQLLGEERQRQGHSYAQFRQAVRADLGPILWPWAELPDEGEFERRVFREEETTLYLLLQLPGLAPLRAAYARGMGRWERRSYRSGRNLEWEVVEAAHARPGSGTLVGCVSQALAVAEERYERYRAAAAPTLPLKATPAARLFAAFKEAVHEVLAADDA